MNIKLGEEGVSGPDYRGDFSTVQGFTPMTVTFPDGDIHRLYIATEVDRYLLSLRKLLDPVCAEETLEGAIRNLQQVALSATELCQELQQPSAPPARRRETGRETRQKTRQEPMVTNDVPRRIRIDQQTPAERAIRAAIDAVEALPADVRLTDAVVLLGAARESVADYVDGIDNVKRWPCCEERKPL